MKTKFFALAGMVSLGVALAGPICLAADQPPAIEPRAEKLMKIACAYLADAPFFMLKGETWREKVVDSGQKLQFSRILEMDIHKPDRLHVDLHAQFSNRGFWYDGKALNVLDRKRNLYSTAEISGNLDSALDHAHDEFGIDIPLIDLAFSDPYGNLTAKVQKGSYLGMSPVLGEDCHHLAFVQENIDWQIWIADGPQPLIRKLVITHKQEPGAPQFTAILTHWDFSTKIADSDFQFEPPAGAAKIPMRKPGESTSPQKAEESAPKPEGGKEVTK